MASRAPDLQDFLDCLQAAFAAAPADADVSRVAAKLSTALGQVGTAGDAAPRRRDVCHYLPAALAPPESAGAELRALAGAFAAIEPSLRWLPRPASGPNASDNWAEGHANAMIVGPGGVEERGDIAVGASLMAPNVRYPDHNHAPEEIYLAMTPGRFQHGDSGWFSPGPGGTLHNLPGIRHAMASTDAPFLAFWCLMLAEAKAA